MRIGKFPLLLAIMGSLLLPAPALAEYTGPNDIKLTIINNTGYSDQDVYLHLTGKGINPDNNLDGHYYRMSMAGQNWVYCSKADNVLTVKRPDSTDYPDTYANYWFKLSEIKDSATGVYSLIFPHMSGGRLWVSFKRPIYFRMNDDALGLAEPTTDPAADSPNPFTFFDKFEFTFDFKDVWLHANTTNVDFLAIPMRFEEKNAFGTLGTLGFTCNRAALVGALSADPLLRPLNTLYRFNSPKETAKADAGLRHHFDAYVNYCWSLYPDTTPDNPLTIGGQTDLGGAFTAHGLVNTSGDLIFTVKDGSGNDIPGETHTIKKPVCTEPATAPSSWDVFACDGVFLPTGANATAPDQRDGFIKAMVSAALNRSVMHLPVAQWKDKNNFYKNTLPHPHEDKFATNNYAKILHHFSLQEKCYAFPYDDKDGWNSEIDAKATEVILTLLNSRGEVVPAVNSLLIGD